MPVRHAPRVGFFYHSVISDWNNGNAHFARGLARELIAAGCHVRVYEQADNWSLTNLRSVLPDPQATFRRLFPDLADSVHVYSPPVSETADPATQIEAWLNWLRRETADLDAVIMHEWNPPALINAAGYLTGPRVLFHDTHYRAITQPELWASLRLDHYTGILSFGPSLSDYYRHTLKMQRVFTFHEAADTRLFHPPATSDSGRPLVRDVVFIGNWGDDDRATTMRSYLFGSAASLPHLRFTVYGVRYDQSVLAEMACAGVRAAGWLANSAAPAIYHTSALAMHIPRQPYLDRLPGTPTIRVFEVLACGIPLLCLPWEDSDGLLTAGRDYLVAHSPAEMVALIDDLAHNPTCRRALGQHGAATVQSRHTCAHRATELLAILHDL